MTSQVPLIEVCGNIGSGKSTTLEHMKTLCENPFVVFADEPVDEWMELRDASSGGKSFLDLYYHNQKTWALPFQLTALNSRVCALTRCVRSSSFVPIVVSERALFSDRIFAISLHKMGIISDFELSVYEYNFQRACEASPCELKELVYLRTDPSLCEARIRRRHREGETDIDLGYLKALHEAHEDAIEKLRAEGTVRIHVVDQDGEKETSCANTDARERATLVHSLVHCLA